MTTDALAELAAAGGAALVAAMATDAWHTARAGFPRLLGRDGRQDAVVGQLEAQADVLERTAESRRDDVRAALAEGWSLQLAGLLQRYPEAEQELRDTIEQVRSQLPEEQPRQGELHLHVRAGRDAYAAARDMTVTHHGEGDRTVP